MLPRLPRLPPRLKLRLLAGPFDWRRWSSLWAASIYPIGNALDPSDRGSIWPGASRSGGAVRMRSTRARGTALVVGFLEGAAG